VVNDGQLRENMEKNVGDDIGVPCSYEMLDVARECERVGFEWCL
jgi:hypothetical protein